MKTRYYVIFTVIGLATIFPVISIVFYDAVPVGINTRYFETCEDCELYECADNEIYDHGICMTLEDKKRAESVGETELAESAYNPYETRCGSPGIPYIPENWQSIGLHPTDKDWENLGRHIIKQEFYEQLKQRNIIFEPACFGVYAGFVETSYPPNFSMCTIVTELDGSKIYLEGSVREFDVTFFEMNEEIPYLCDESHHGCLCGMENEN